MTKFSVGEMRSLDRSRSPVDGDGSRRPTRDGATCDLYAAGHLMHYRHQGDAVRSPSTPVRELRIDDTLLTLVLQDSRELPWRHHDPERLLRILDLLGGKCVIYQQHHALRVGPYWFNCAPDDSWQDCRGGHDPGS